MGPFATLTELFAGLAEYGSRPAVLADRDGTLVRWSFAELVELGQRLAAGLLAAGVRSEEPVGILAANRAEWIIAYFGIVAAGATAVPLDYLAGDREIVAMLSKAGCRRLFTTRDRLARLRQGGPDNIARSVYLFDDEGEGGPAEPGAVGWRTLLPEHAGVPPAVAPQHRASLLFTSGTTGAPKAVPLTHANFVANLRALLGAGIVGPGERVLLPLPLHHAYPFTVGMLGALASGAALVLPAGLTGPEILRAIRAARASVVIGVPALYAALLNGIEARIAREGRWVAGAYRRLLALSIWLRRIFRLRAGRILFGRVHREFGRALRVLSVGGAKLEPELAWKLEGLGWQVLSGYGLTETGPILTFNMPAEARLDSEGRPIAGVELRIAAAPGETPGEILARGPSVFSGYLDDAAADREAFADSGWFRTGDLGYLDRAGYLHVVGRKTETITLPTGKKLFLEDVEAAYAGMPFVKDLAVLLHDNALVALIVLEPEAIRERGAARVEGLLREAIELHRAGLKPQERIGGYAIHRGALPRTHLGKLKRHLLPALYAQIKARLVEPEPVELSPADRDLLQRPLSAEIWRWLESLYPDRKLTFDTSPQLDLGVDSLHWIELTTEIQDRFGARLTEATIARVLTLRDLLQEISRSAAAPRPAPVAPATLPEPPGPAHLALGLLLYAGIAIALRLLFRLSVRGRANIPVDGPLVFAPNHASYLDPVTLAAALTWSELRRTCWGGWTAILFGGRFMRAVSRAANVLPVDPDRDPGGALALAVAALREGRRLVWFPEGRMSPTGELGEFLPGIGRLLTETDARAVPVRIGGTFAALPRGRRIPRLRRLSVVFGAPVSRAELAQRGQGKDAETRIADALRACVAALPER